MKMPRMLLLTAICAVPLTAVGAGSHESAKTMYANSCAMCHGADGKGTMPGAGDMTDPKGPLSHPDAVLVDRTLSGVGNMPAFKGQLNKDQASEIIAYMRKAFGVPAPH